MIELHKQLVTPWQQERAARPGVGISIELQNVIQKALGNTTNENINNSTAPHTTWTTKVLFLLQLQKEKDDYKLLQQMQSACLWRASHQNLPNLLSDTFSKILFFMVLV